MMATTTTTTSSTASTVTASAVDDSAMVMLRRDVAVSAPGKVLLCGGYLIAQPPSSSPTTTPSSSPPLDDDPPLESRHEGIVLAVDRRFYCRGHLRVTSSGDHGEERNTSNKDDDEKGHPKDAEEFDSRPKPLEENDSSQSDPPRLSTGSFVIRVESPQYGESYEYLWHASQPCQLTDSSPHRKNTFVEHTLRMCCDYYSSELSDLLVMVSPPAQNGAEVCAVHPDGVHVAGEIRLVVLGDDEFWSHPSPRLSPIEPTEEVAVDPSPRSSSITSEPPPPSSSPRQRRRQFRKAPRDADGTILKTGLGSSACLVTSIVAAMDYLLFSNDESDDYDKSNGLSDYADYEESGDADEREPQSELAGSDRRSRHRQQQRLKRIGNLSQLCHCVAQGKIGSGFDVSAACYGSHVYQRFDDANIRWDEFVDGPNSPTEPSTNVPQIVNDESWTRHCVVSPMAPPPHHRSFVLDVILADTAGGGTSSPGMSRRVLQHVHSKEWNDLVCINRTLLELWSRVVQLDLSDRDRQLLASYTAQEWIGLGQKFGAQEAVVEVESDVSEAVCRAAQLLGELSHAFKKWRAAFKALGARAGADLEPDAQSVLADSTEGLQGVVAAVVPGAGGHDALACLYVNDESTRRRVIEHWRSYPADGVPALNVRIVPFGDGVRVEDLDSFLTDVSE